MALDMANSDACSATGRILGSFKSCAHLRYFRYLHLLAFVEIRFPNVFFWETKTGFVIVMKKSAGCGNLEKMEGECEIRSPPSRPSTIYHLTKRNKDETCLQQPLYVITETETVVPFLNVAKRNLAYSFLPNTILRGSLSFLGLWRWES